MAETLARSLPAFTTASVQSRWKAAWRSGIAIAAVLLAWPSTNWLQSLMPERSLSLIFFFGAIAISAGFAGLWAGLFATILSALICDYFFLAPVHSLALARGDLPIFILFI